VPFLLLLIQPDSPIFYCRGISFPTHILYADDILIFCIATKKNIRCLLKIFSDYFEASGQVISPLKSKFCTGAMTNLRTTMISNMLEFTEGVIPFDYFLSPKVNQNVSTSKLLLIKLK